jgi:hypothetical protein
MIRKDWLTICSVNECQREANVKTSVAFGWIGYSLLLLLLSVKAAPCKQATVTHPINVTVSELGIHPQEYDGKLVCVNAVAVYGWEGDNFLVDPSKPAPVEFPSRNPASIWFYSKQLYSMLRRQPQRSDESIERTSDCHDLEGYFHFVDKPHVIGAFYPGSLQLECLGTCPRPDPQPHSLATATHFGDIDETRRILRSNVDLRDKYKNLFLSLAVNTGRIDFAQELLAAGADAKFASPSGNTALMTAAWRDDMKTARLLLNHGAQINATNSNGETALMVAIHGCWDGKTGFSPEAAEAAKSNPDIQGRRDTFENCRDGKMVQLLLDAGADPNIKTVKGFTALLGAAMEGNAADTEELLKAGADPAPKSDGSPTPESESCDRGDGGKFRVCELVREAVRNAPPRSKP